MCESMCKMAETEGKLTKDKEGLDRDSEYLSSIELLGLFFVGRYTICVQKPHTILSFFMDVWSLYHLMIILCHP